MTMITFTVHDYAGVKGQDRTFQVDNTSPVQKNIIWIIQDHLTTKPVLPYRIAELGITIIEIVEPKEGTLQP